MDAANGVEALWWPFGGDRDKEERGEVTVIVLVQITLFLIAFLAVWDNSKHLYFFEISTNILPTF